MLLRTDLWIARQGGYHNYRVPCILATASGVVLTTVEARRGHGGDWDASDLLLRRSVDGGQSWAPAQRLAVGADYGPGPVHNCVLIWDRETQVVHVFYCYNYARVFAMTSQDEGSTFSPPLEITDVFVPYREQYAWRVVAVGPGHGIQLRNGRLIVPFWMSTGEGHGSGEGKLSHQPSVVASLYSDDHGRSWQRGEIVAWHSSQISNPSETVAVELSDGHVLFNIRNETDHHRRLIAVSPDGATRWSAPVPDAALLEPVCMASLIRYDPEPDVFLFANPDTLERDLIPDGPWPHRDRRRLTVKLSRDDARTWSVAQVLEPGPAGYSDLAVLPDGTAICLYENGMVDHMFDPATVTIARFDLSWLIT